MKILYWDCLFSCYDDSQKVGYDDAGKIIIESTNYGCSHKSNNGDCMITSKGGTSEQVECPLAELDIKDYV